MASIRVLILAGWYPNHNNPMKGVFIREQAAALHRAGVKVAVFYPYDEEILPGKSEERVENGLTVYRANTLGMHNRYIARLTSYYSGLKELREIDNVFSPDLVHAHVAYPAGILAWLFSRYTGTPYVITEHMSYLKDYVDKFQHRILLKLAFQGARCVLPVSQALAEQIRGFGWETNLLPVPNVVNTDRFTAVSAKPVLGLTENCPKGARKAAPEYSLNLLFVGSLEETEVKGLNLLLPAFAQLLREDEQRKKPHLHIVGDGSKRGEYEAVAKELKITEHCTFHGQVEPDNMVEFYQQADLLVSASHKETFGCVLIEAMACGKPVLATRCGGPQEIVRPEVGILVDPGSSAELYEGLVASLEALSSYDAKAIRSYAIEHYGPEAIAEKLKTIYAEILAAKG